jgi:hypothetical protein
MGIEKFYFAIRDKLRDNIIPLSDILQKATILHIDFNSIIHKTSEHVVFELNNEFLLKMYNEKNKQFDANLIDGAISWRESIDKVGQDINLKKKIIKEIIKNVDQRVQHATLAKIIYLAFDGIPEMSKCIEQKNRRSIGFTIGKIEENIEEHNIDKLGKVFNSYLINRFKFDRGDISAYTKFMSDLVDELEKKYTGNAKVKISGVDEYSEGEKKIMYELLKNNDITDNDVILILSPDADMILLAGIALCHIRENNATNPNIYVYNKEIVNVKVLENYINNEIKQINNKMKKISETYTDGLIGKSVMFRDFIFLCTFFGNDFLPKILSFSEVYDNIDILLVVYTQTLSENNNLLIKNGKYSINFNRLKAIIKALITVDKDSSNYKIYVNNKIKNSTRKIDERHIEELKDSLQKYGYEKTMYYNYIDMKKRDAKKLFTVTEFDCARYLCENPFHFFLFSRQPSTLVYKTNIDLLEIVEKNKKEIPGDVIKYIEKEFTSYDIELIAFRNKKSAWKIVLNDVNYDRNINMPKEEIVRNYVDGLIWVADWYFNRIMKKDDISLWYYKGHNTPFLIHIYDFLEKNEVKEPESFLVNADKYFTKAEYKQYVMLTDRDKEKIIDYVEKIMNILYTAQVKYTSDDYEKVLKKLGDAGWDKRIFIDCHHSRFINKCIIDIKYVDYNTYIKSVRQKGGGINYLYKCMKYMEKIERVFNIRNSLHI